jgi:hypothetical protein
VFTSSKFRPQERENFRYFDEHSPERKIELVDGRVLVGNSLDGSRLLLDHVLRGWGIDAAAALVHCANFMGRSRTSMRTLHTQHGPLRTPLQEVKVRMRATTGSENTSACPFSPLLRVSGAKRWDESS